MNGVHSQIMTRITEPSAWVDSQATWWTPNGCSSQFTSPNCGSSIGPAHTSAAATGMTRNGVMISVRTMLAEELAGQQHRQQHAEDHGHDHGGDGHHHRAHQRAPE